jgi:F-type H+-transporting ATPase subunit epsilon
MADTLDLEVVTPERSRVHEQVSEVQVPGKDGYMGILPGHAPLLSQLGSGFLAYVVHGDRRYLAVHGGILEVLEDHVRVLTDAAERADEIDVERARAAQRRATEQVLNPGVDPAVAREALERAQTRIAMAEQRLPS